MSTNMSKNTDIGIGKEKNTDTDTDRAVTLADISPSSVGGGGGFQNIDLCIFTSE
jgi:hypothetical protein